MTTRGMDERMAGEPIVMTFGGRDFVVPPLRYGDRARFRICRIAPDRDRARFRVCRLLQGRDRARFCSWERATGRAAGWLLGCEVPQQDPRRAAVSPWT